MRSNVDNEGLRELFKAGFESITRRMDEAQQLSKERHTENSERLIRIEAEASKTNGRVSQLEADAKAAAKMADAWPSLKTWIVIVGGAFAAFWFVIIQLAGYHR